MTVTVSLTRVTHLAGYQIAALTNAKENCVYVASDTGAHYEGQQDGTTRESIRTMSELRTYNHAHSVVLNPAGHAYFTTNIYVPSGKRIKVGVGNADSDLDVDGNIKMRLNPSLDKVITCYNAGGAATWQWQNGDGDTVGSVRRGVGKTGSTAGLVNGYYHFQVPLKPSTNANKTFMCEMTAYFADNTQPHFKAMYTGEIDGAGTGLVNVNISSAYPMTDITAGAYVGTADRMFIWVKPVTTSNTTITLDSYVAQGGVRLDTTYFLPTLTIQAII